VDGQVVNLIHVGQGDIEGSTIFHVPSAGAVICGDVVYNNVHMMMYEADEAKREAWIASIDGVAALKPEVVVAGHKSVGAGGPAGEPRGQPAVPARLHHRRAEGRHGGGPGPRHARIARRTRPAAHPMDLGPSRSSSPDV